MISKGKLQFIFWFGKGTAMILAQFIKRAVETNPLHCLKPKAYTKLPDNEMSLLPSSWPQIHLETNVVASRLERGRDVKTLF